MRGWELYTFEEIFNHVFKSNPTGPIENFREVKCTKCMEKAFQSCGIFVCLILHSF